MDFTQGADPIPDIKTELCLLKVMFAEIQYNLKGSWTK
jgi:hypothetical protein